jgi:hypothetical protein
MHLNQAVIQDAAFKYRKPQVSTPISLTTSIQLPPHLTLPQTANRTNITTMSFLTSIRASRQALRTNYAITSTFHTSAVRSLKENDRRQLTP